MDVKETLLFKFVEEKSPEYYDELIKLRTHAEHWLANINTTFPHYPSHGIDHSDQIIKNISLILFKNADISKPVASKFNEVEASILIAAAYTHDIGMVVSDDEKLSITKTEEWKSYLQNTPEAKDTWEKIEGILSDADSASDIADKSEKLFLAGVSQRHLFSEFFRRKHVQRSGVLLRFNPTVFGADFLKDRQFRDAVAKVGEAHGVGYTDLENTHKYPEATVIKGKPVNLRFLAIMMRFGDLLDMRVERSSTTYRNLSLMPKSSIPHWDQYENFRDENINHEEISLTAYCPSQESYRTLRQWCCWIEEESKKSNESMRRSKRHADWVAPIVKVAPAEGEAQKEDTIIIKPSLDANFEPHDWKFYFNKSQIIQRLTTDIYKGDELVFLRELIQNALDASRARLVARLNEDDEEIPEFLTDVDEYERNKFPIKISIEEHEDKDNGHQYQWITIEDKGIGMDAHIIQNYFLQIGQSFYTTNEFKDEYHFSPTSRFGVGFLSVFGISNHIEITTYKGYQKGQPIKLTLNSPNDFLLTEKQEEKMGSGTKIAIRLRNYLDNSEVVNYIKKVAARAEFPIEINNLGKKEKVFVQEFNEFSIPVMDAKYTKDSKFKFIVYDLKDENHIGQLGVWFLQEKNKLTLNYGMKLLEKSLKFSHHNVYDATYFYGVLVKEESKTNRVNSSWGNSIKYKSWIDYRGAEAEIDISRTNINTEKHIVSMKKVHKIIQDEISKNSYTIDQLHRVLRNTPSLSLFPNLDKLPLINGYLKGKEKEITIKDLKEVNEFYYIHSNDMYGIAFQKNPELRMVIEKTIIGSMQYDNIFILLQYELSRMILLYREINNKWGKEFKPISVSATDFPDVFISKYSKENNTDFRWQSIKNCNEFYIECTNFSLLAYYGFRVLNLRHPCASWLYKIKNANNLSDDDRKKIEATIDLEDISQTSLYNILELGKLGIISKEFAPPSKVDKPWEGSE